MNDGITTPWQEDEVMAQIERTKVLAAEQGDALAHFAMFHGVGISESLAMGGDDTEIEHSYLTLMAQFERD